MERIPIVKPAMDRSTISEKSTQIVCAGLHRTSRQTEQAVTVRLELEDGVSHLQRNFLVNVAHLNGPFAADAITSPTRHDSTEEAAGEHDIFMMQRTT